MLVLQDCMDKLVAFKQTFGKQFGIISHNNRMKKNWNVHAHMQQFVCSLTRTSLKKRRRNWFLCCKRISTNGYMADGSLRC